MAATHDDNDGRPGSRRRLARRAYAGGAVVAAAAMLLLVMVNLAVGFLGSEDNPANVIFLAVIAVAIVGSIIARFRAAGMAKAMSATAAVQLLIGLIALAASLGSAGWHGVYEVALGTGLFGALWLLSAWLFRKAVGETASAPEAA
jgi:O-antigen/teichoic acid export membrane protein